MGRTMGRFGMHPARAKTIMPALKMYGAALVGGLATASVIGTAVPMMESNRVDALDMRKLAKKEFDRADFKKTGYLDFEEARRVGISKEKFSTMTRTRTVISR